MNGFAQYSIRFFGSNKLHSFGQRRSGSKRTYSMAIRRCPVDRRCTRRAPHIVDLPNERRCDKNNEYHSSFLQYTLSLINDDIFICSLKFLLPSFVRYSFSLSLDHSVRRSRSLRLLCIDSLRSSNHKMNSACVRTRTHIDSALEAVSLDFSQYFLLCVFFFCTFLFFSWTNSVQSCSPLADARICLCFRSFLFTKY